MKRALAACSLGLLSLVATETRAEESALASEARCGPEPASGRLLCRVTLRTKAAKERLVWADVLVAKAPDFVRPLRARVRVSVDEKGEQGEGVLALVADRGAAPGEIVMRTRAVVCGEELCRALSREVRVLVSPA